MSIERRLMSGTVELEERAGGTPKIRGVAAVYNSESNDLGGFREVIEPGAFDHLIDQRRKDAAEVVALWNHDSSQLLGRTSAKTLRLWSDEHGLHYEIDPVPNTSLGRDLIEHIKLGNVRGSSFAFTVDSAGQRVDEDKETGKITRYITRATGLFDVSPVTRPAYDATAVKVRSLEEIKAMIPEETTPAPEEPKAEQKPLTARDKWNLARVRSWVARLCLLLAVLAIATPAEARIFGRRSRGGSYSSVPAGHSNDSAQCVANACAAMGRLAHIGGIGKSGASHEGLGMGSSPEAAYRSCCYANSGMATVDVGYAQTRSGQWVCCRRYR